MQFASQRLQRKERGAELSAELEILVADHRGTFSLFVLFFLSSAGECGMKREDEEADESIITACSPLSSAWPRHLLSRALPSVRASLLARAWPLALVAKVCPSPPVRKR